MMAAALLSLLLAAAAPPEPQAARCEAIARDSEAAFRGGDADRLRKLHGDATACDPSLAGWIGRRAAQLLYNRAIAREPADEAAIVLSLAYGRTWQALATLGELAAGRRDYALAARRYQEALIEIGDPKATPTPPAEAVILSVRRQAEQASLLSPTYVPLARSRDGSIGGLGASTIRGVNVVAMALPVQFKFDSVDFTEPGEAAVRDLVALLKAEQRAPGRITLIGHTDAKGDADYNRGLSLRRAQAVRAYLARQGVKADVVAEGRGEAEPYQPDDAGRYSEAERDQMSRRVELRRK